MQSSMKCITLYTPEISNYGAACTTFLLLFSKNLAFRDLYKAPENSKLVPVNNKSYERTVPTFRDRQFQVTFSCLKISISIYCFIKKHATIKKRNKLIRKFYFLTPFFYKYFYVSLVSI